MSIASVVTLGIGPGSTVPLLVLLGFDIGEFVVTEHYGPTPKAGLSLYAAIPKAGGGVTLPVPKAGSALVAPTPKAGG